MRLQPGVNGGCPRALSDQSQQRYSGTEDHGAPCSGDIAEPGIESENQHRSGAGEPESTHQCGKHIDVIHIPEKERNDEKEYGDAQRGKAKQGKMCFGGYPFLFDGSVKRQDQILHQCPCRIEDAAVIRGDEQHYHQQAEDAHHSRGKQIAQHCGHHHLLEKRTEFLKILTGFRSIPQCFPYGVKIESIQIFLLRKRTGKLIIL